MRRTLEEINRDIAAEAAHQRNRQIGAVAAAHRARTSAALAQGFARPPVPRELVELSCDATARTDVATDGRRFLQLVETHERVTGCDRRDAIHVVSQAEPRLAQRYRAWVLTRGDETASARQHDANRFVELVTAHANLRKGRMREAIRAVALEHPALATAYRLAMGWR
jgi:hypothetical protein